MTMLYLAQGFGGEFSLVRAACAGFGPFDVLVAFPTRSVLTALRVNGLIGHLAIDSGAFSAHTTGLKIDVDEFTDFCLGLTDATDIFGLDVIGDMKASWKNYERSWSRGVPVIPTIHLGASSGYIKECAAAADKVAIGGVARGVHIHDRYRFFDRVFSLIWPKRIHGFGQTDSRVMLRYPFHSVDSTSWLMAPSGFGRWVGISRVQRSVPLRIYGGPKVADYTMEIREYQRRGRAAASRWKVELGTLEKIDATRDTHPVRSRQTCSTRPGKETVYGKSVYDVSRRSRANRRDMGDRIC